MRSATVTVTITVTGTAAATLLADRARSRVRTPPAVRRRATAVLTVGTGARLRWDLCLHLRRAEPVPPRRVAIRAKVSL